MEREGLERMVKHFDGILEIDTLVTDRHRQIAKWIRINMPHTKHFFDIWHVAKCMYNISLGKETNSSLSRVTFQTMLQWGLLQTFQSYRYILLVYSCRQEAEGNQWAEGM